MRSSGGVHLRSGKVAFVRIKVLSAVPMARTGCVEATARSAEGRAAVLSRDAIAISVQQNARDVEARRVDVTLNALEKPPCF